MYRILLRILTQPLACNIHLDPWMISSAYDSGIRRLIDKHAPLQVKTITLRSNTPWYTEDIREAKHKRRKAERLWRRTKLTVHHQMFKEECRNIIALLIKAKRKSEKSF